MLAAFVPANAQKTKETYQYAVKGTDTLFVDRHIDASKVKGDLIPTMIYMYGGGWAFGGRGGDFSYLTDIGVQVISIDYRKGLTKYGYNPAPPEEMEKAIDMALDDLTDAMVFVGSNEKIGWNLCLVMHKNVEQALGRSLRNLFEKLAWRTSPAAVRELA